MAMAKSGRLSATNMARLFLVLACCLVGLFNLDILAGLQRYSFTNTDCSGVIDHQGRQSASRGAIAGFHGMPGTTSDKVMDTKQTISMGVVYVLGLNTPQITQYLERNNGGRGPYLDEIAESVTSLRQHTRIPVALIVDTMDLPANFTSMFSTVILFDSAHVKGGWGEKIAALPLSPFDYTMFLDADVHICNNFDHIFKVLDFVDLAFVLEHELKSWLPPALDEFEKVYIDDIPKYMFSFLHANSGMLLFKKNRQVLDFFAKWQDIHSKASLSATESVGDQYYFPYVLWNSDLRFLPLPSNYNLRFHGNIAPVPLRNKVYIVHARTMANNKNMACSVINRNATYRLQDPVHGAKMVSDIFKY